MAPLDDCKTESRISLESVHALLRDDKARLLRPFHILGLEVQRILEPNSLPRAHKHILCFLYFLFFSRDVIAVQSGKPTEMEPIPKRSKSTRTRTFRHGLFSSFFARSPWEPIWKTNRKEARRMVRLLGAG